MECHLGIDDPEPMTFDEMLDHVLVVVEEEKQRLAEKEGIVVEGGDTLSKNPF